MRLKEAGVFKILGEIAKWANNSGDKQIQSITDEFVTGLDVFFSILCTARTARGGQNEPSLFSLLSLSFLPSVNALKRIKSAPDMSIPTRGIEKHLGCRLPGLPPWMLASDEGKKNETL